MKVTYVSDSFVDNTDSDPEFIPGSESSLDCSKPLFRLAQILNRRNKISSDAAQQLQKTDRPTVCDGSRDCDLSDVEVRSGPVDKPTSPEGRCSPDTARGRKRKRNPNKWKSARQRTNRLSGKEYKTRTGRIVAENSKCARKSNEKILTDERQSFTIIL